MSLITVKSTRPDDQVVLWEKNPLHPEDVFGNREAFIAGPKPVQVADTPLVLLKVQQGELERLSEAASLEATAAADRARVEAERAEAERVAAEQAAQVVAQSGKVK